MTKPLFFGAALAAFLSAPVMAADLSFKAPPIAAPAPSWTGFYVGLDVGYGWNDRTVTATGNDPVTILVLTGTSGGPGNAALGPATVENRGVFGGIEGGYNWQINRNWLVGVEADFNASSIDGQGISASPVGGEVQQLAVTQNLLWFGTVRPRIGWLANDDLLLYATGGFAYGRVNNAVNYGLSLASGFSQPGAFGFLCPAAFGPCIDASSTRIATGWTAGAGAEYRLPGSRASVKAEYLYVNLGGSEVLVGVAGAIPGNAARASSITFTNSPTDFHTVKLGLNWHL